MNTGPHEHGDAGGDEAEGNHGQEHHARGGHRQRHEEIPHDRRHVEQQRLLQREIQLIEAVAQALDLGHFELARQEDRLVGQELREADARCPESGRGSR